MSFTGFPMAAGMASLLVSLLLSMCAPPSPSPLSSGTASAGGITLTWTHEGDALRCRVQAPTTGWVGVGFNEADGLSGTHLVMGAVVDGEAVVSDRTIVAPGDHRPVEAVGGASALSEVSGTERDGTTEIAFALPAATSDAWSHDLREGTTVHLLLGYSVADDFDHHSRVRRHLVVRL